jgi:predicted phage terminase large subunit-like protein
LAVLATHRPSNRANLSGWGVSVNAGPFHFGARTASSTAVASQVQPFGEWLTIARPEYQWDARHFRVMQFALDRVTSGEITRLYFQIPIRHGKTEHNTVSYAASRLEHDPTTRILVGSYNDKRAQKFSRDIRRLAIARGVVMSKDRNAAGEWETEAGGGVQAVGAGAGVASVNADLILIDDPIGSRDDAESQAKRDQVWDWLTNDILARCEPQTAVVMTMSRWHQDDPAGRLRDQQAERWTIIDLPAEAEENDALGRALHEPLWPELRNAEWLANMRLDIGAYGFASLLQGRPRPREGGMFKWAWWQLIDHVPATGRMVRYWDLAGTEPKGGGHDPDFSAGAMICQMADLRNAIVDVTRFRKSIAQRDAELEVVCRSDLAAYHGRVCWWIETEAGIAGGERTAALVRRLQALGMPVYTEHPTGKKIHRAEPLASKAEVGNVVLVRGAWNDPFRSEAADFPNGKHDDQIDAAAGADSKLTSVGEVGFSSLSL